VTIIIYATTDYYSFPVEHRSQLTRLISTFADMRRYRSRNFIIVATVTVLFFIEFLQRLFHTAASPSNGKLVTFIVPTLMRDSLNNTIASISMQESNNWEAIVVLHALNSTQDGEVVCPDFVKEDVRYRCVGYGRKTYANCGGAMRNFAMLFVKTPWVAFVDDDDTISPLYSREILREAILDPQVDLVAFRMYDKRLPDDKFEVKVLPRVQDTTAVRYYIGISFAFKRTMSSVDYFIESTTEDFDFIVKFCEFNKCVLSDSITYFVKGSSTPLLRAGGRHYFRTSESYESSVDIHRARGRCLQV